MMLTSCCFFLSIRLGGMVDSMTLKHSAIGGGQDGARRRGERIRELTSVAAIRNATFEKIASRSGTFSVDSWSCGGSGKRGFG